MDKNNLVKMIETMGIDKRADGAAGVHLKLAMH